jgi:hypothetical protein
MAGSAWTGTGGKLFCPEKPMELKPIEVIDVLAFLLGIAALLLAILGIRDVRKQVHMLVTMERDRTLTRLIRTYTWDFVKPTNTNLRRESIQLLQEYTAMAHAVDKTVTSDSAQDEVGREILRFAAELVEEGSAKWKPYMDPGRAQEIVKKWKVEKMVKTMFGANKK